MLGLTFFGYSMDSAPKAKRSRSVVGEQEDAVYRVICERRSAADDTPQNKKERARAAYRICGSQRSADQLMFYAHKGMMDNYLQSPAGNRFACLDDNCVVVRHETEKKLYSITVIQMPRQIILCAFNANGEVFASATTHELYVSDVVCNSKKESTLRLERFLYGIQHVALSDSGNRVAVGTKSRSSVLRFMVIDVQKNQLLHDLPGFGSPERPRDCAFFYMMNENIIATCFTALYRQYDLNVAEAVAALTEKQKDVIAMVYGNYKKRKRCLSLRRDSSMYAIYVRLPFLIRSHVSKLVRIVDC
jgi:hypothetical protein